VDAGAAAGGKDRKGDLPEPKPDHDQDRDHDQDALVTAARQGDRAALGTLVMRHRPVLVAVCRGALGDADLAEDAAQEAVLLALTSLDRLRQADRFGPWLAGIGLNVCRRWLRERSRASWSWEAIQGGHTGDWRVPGPGPAELAEAEEDARLVRAAVARLPPGQRVAVTLHYLAGLTQAETAARAGTTVGAVKVRLHKARVRLRERLAPRWKEERMAVDEATRWVEMRVVDVRRGAATGDVPERHVVLLEEVGGARRLSIWVGPFEGTALAMALRGAELPRPDSFRFMGSLLAATGGTLREIRVTRLVGTTFHGEAVVDSVAGEGLVDARPSDALNLALLLGAPIRVDPVVIDDAASRPVPWDERGEELPAGAAEIVSERQAEWERARETTVRATEQSP
jgi:RNA polymerase sigma factor (sigma-70 family)